MSKKLARGVSIIGAGYTPIGLVGETPEIKDMSERELFSWASLEAMKQANIKASEIDAYYVGMSGPNFTSRTKSAAPHFGAWIGMENKPSLFYDAGCGTGIVGLQMAVQAIASGMCDCVISTCVNISSSLPLWAQPPHLREKISYEENFNQLMLTALDGAYEKPGCGAISAVDMNAEMYCRKYGYSNEDLDEGCIKWESEHRKFALNNERGTSFNETLEEEAEKAGFDNVYDYMTSPKHNPGMASFIRNKYFGLSRDGASSIVVCASELAEKYTDKPIEILGIANNTLTTKDFASIPWENQKNLFDAVYGMVDEPFDPYNDVDWMYIHDCPTTLVLPIAEVSGYVREGEALKIMKETGFGLEGDKHINTEGGRSQLGHPLSPAFNMAMTEFIEQSRGEAGARQLKKPPKTGVFWIGGSGFNAGAVLVRAK